MEMLKPGDEITYAGEKQIVKAFKKNFLTKKFFVIFEDGDNKEYPWPEPNVQYEEVKEIKDELIVEEESIEEDLDFEEEELKKPQIKRKKKPSKK